MKKKTPYKIRKTVTKEKSRRMVLMRPGQVISERRKCLGLRIVELAKKANVKSGTLDAIEKGRIQMPSLPMLQALARALGVSVASFFSGVKPEAKESFQMGNQKGFQTVEFQKHGFRIVCYTPLIPDIFVGKVIMGAGIRVTHALLPTSGMIFVQSVIGKLLVQFDGTDYLVREGNHAFFDGNFPHAFHNPQPKESSFLLVTAPSFMTRQSRS